MRQGKSEVTGYCFEYTLSGGIILSQCLGKMFGFTSCFYPKELGKRAIRIGFDCLTNRMVHSPTRTAIFHCGAGRIQAQMSHLDFARAVAVINFSINHQSSPDSAAHIHVEGGVKPASGAAQRFSQGRAV